MPRLVCALLLSLLLAPGALAGPAGVEVSIRGRIANLAQAAAILNRLSRLQMVFIRPGGKVVLMVRQGKLVFKSHLPPVRIMARGDFAFSGLRLAPGKYWLVVQPVELGFAGGGHATWLEKQGRRLVIQVTRQRKKPLQIDLGAVTIALPR